MTVWYALYTRQSSTKKHVEKRNKHTKKNYAPSWLYLQNYTEKHGQQNLKINKK